MKRKRRDPAAVIVEMAMGLLTMFGGLCLVCAFYNWLFNLLGCA